MDFHTYTTLREACKRSGMNESPDEFYRAAFADAVAHLSRGAHLYVDVAFAVEDAERFGHVLVEVEIVGALKANLGDLGVLHPNDASREQAIAEQVRSILFPRLLDTQCDDAFNCVCDPRAQAP